MQLLLVEPDAVFRDRAHAALRDLSATILDARDVAEAREHLRTSPIDCVIVNWPLLEAAVHPFVDEVHAQSPDIPLVVLTTSATRAQAEAALGPKAQSYAVTDVANGHGIGCAVQIALGRRRVATMQSRLAHADRLASAGQLAAGVAHEVNQPATVLTSNLELLQDVMKGASSYDPGLVHELITESLQSVDRIASVLRQLIGFARQRSAGFTAMSLHLVVDEAVRLARPTMRHRARLDVQAPPTRALVVDRTALVGVVVNLLVNAQQAIDAAPLGPHAIRVALSETAGGVLLTVEDSGPGVAEQSRDEIFDAFVTRRDDGLGLGLAICREVVESHRGRIHVEQSAMGGAAFVVELPYDTGRQVAQRPSVPDWTTPLDVLVLDDQPDARRAIAKQLGLHRVVEASTVHEAWAIIQGGPTPDVILCDLMLDGELGSALYERIASERPELVRHVLMITGGAVTPEAQSFLSNVDPPTLFKPFKAVELRFGIQQLLGRAVARQSLER